MKSVILRHKILYAAALILMGLAFTACGGGGGHSAAYQAGYDWASKGVAGAGAGELRQVNPSDADQGCGVLAKKGFNGSNDSTEWIKGCADAIAHKAGH
jgi:hypothetical protein